MAEKRNKRWMASRLAQVENGACFSRQVQLWSCITDGWPNRLTAHKKNRVDWESARWTG
jgi:hypothetical protein